MMKKILIVYATAGIGHKKAAMAVKKAFDEMALRDVEVKLIDALDYTNDFFKWSYLQAYLLMVNKMPLFWGLSYYLTDNYFINLFVSGIRRFNNWINSKKFVKFLFEYKPDVIISSHFFASEIISDLKERKAITSRLVTIITDYRMHSWWVGDYTDAYIISSEDVKSALIKWKAEPSIIKVLGIPVEPIFTKPLDRKGILERNNLKEEPFTVLVIGGGFGVGPIEDIVKVIGGISDNIQMVVVCGKNEELRKKIEALIPNMKATIRSLGFVDNVYEYMDIADILISKSGGITVTESLVKELPMVVISPIIGQETANCSFLIKYNAGLKIKRPQELEGVVKDLMAHPEKLAAMKDAIRRVRRPNACYDVAKLAMQLSGK